MSGLIEKLRKVRCDSPRTIEQAIDEIERLTEIADTNYSKWKEQVERTRKLLARVEALEGFIHTYTEGEFVDDLAAVKAGREALAATEQEGET